MSNPNTIYQLSRKNPTIYHYVTSWERGEITWNKALLWMAYDLENQYRTIVTDNNLEEYLEKTGFSERGKLPILDISLKPRLDEEFFKLSPLRRQSKVIEAIVLILEFHSNVSNLAVAKMKRELPKIITGNTDGLAITGGDNS